MFKDFLINFLASVMSINWLRAIFLMQQSNEQ